MSKEMIDLPLRTTGSLQDRARMREAIEFMELANRRQQEDKTVEGTNPEGAPDLLRPLHRPEYATSPGIIGRDDAEVDFYVSCKQGRMDAVTEYVESCQPPNAVCQYGLEQASFAYRPAVVRYLLDSGTTFHGNAFTHANRITENAFVKMEYVHTESIFNGPDRSKDIIALLEVFLDVGWHPYQPWPGAQSENKFRVFDYIWGQKPVIQFLIERLPDLRIDSGGVLLRCALRACDTELLDLLLSRGADATLGTDTMLGTPLLTLVERFPSDVEKGLARSSGHTLRPPIPFSERRATAEWLLRHGVRVNDVVRVRTRQMTWPCRQWDDETALSLACSAEDYEFAEWLLENGADPELLQGQALSELWWAFPEYGKNDRNVVRELVDRVRARHGGKLPAEAGADG